MKKLRIKLLSIILLSGLGALAQNIPIAGIVFPGRVDNVLSNANLKNTNSFTLQNTGKVPLSFYMASSATAKYSGNGGITVAANSNVVATVSQLGGISAGNFLNVSNLESGRLTAGIFTVLGPFGPPGTGGPTPLCSNTPLPQWNPVASNKTLHVCPPETKVGIGNTSPQHTLDVTGDGQVSTNLTVGADLNVNGAITGQSISCLGSMAVNGDIIGLGSQYITGQVGIGIIPGPNTKLAVDGIVGAREVQVLAAGVSFPDYVFKKDYKLLSLAELENYIELNQHLPNIPSAKEIEKDQVIKLGELNTKVLEKVEELTLYIIAQNKVLMAQQKEINKLKKAQRK